MCRVPVLLAELGMQAYVSLDRAASRSPQLGGPDPSLSIITLAAPAGIDRHLGP